VVSVGFLLGNNQSFIQRANFHFSSPKYLDQIKDTELKTAQVFGAMSVFTRCRSGLVLFFHSARLVDSLSGLRNLLARAGRVVWGSLHFCCPHITFMVGN